VRLRFRFLRWLSARLARRQIVIDDRLYLSRYYLAGPIQGAAKLWPEDDQPRERLGWLRRTWYLHKIHRPDAERDMHDHPWDGRGRVLAGAYMERTPQGVALKSEGDKTHVTPGGYHRISQLVTCPSDPAREIWTLLRVGPVVHGWGYLVDGAHVPHAEYHARPVHRRHSRGTTVHELVSQLTFGGAQ